MHLAAYRPGGFTLGTGSWSQAQPAGWSELNQSSACAHWHWDNGTQAFYRGAPGVVGSVPGIGLEVAKWLAEKQIACVGADNWGIEVDLSSCWHARS